MARAAVKAELQQLLAEEERERLAAVDRRAVAWLALAPGWTDTLAAACHFPASGASLQDTLAQLEAAGLAQSEPQTDHVDFWMPAAERPGVLEALRRDPGVDALVKLAGGIGERIAKAQLGGAAAPERTARWATLARRLNGGPAAAANELNLLIDAAALADAGRDGEMLAWLEAARPLADLVGVELQTAVRLGQRKLELAYRHRADERHLGHYLERAGQLQAFEALLRPDPTVWALHYLGMGGVGKTMLLRYLSARLAPQRDLVMARIDFDFINPAYPVRLPGQLLLELAAELQPYGLDSLFGSFSQTIGRLHAEIPPEGLVEEPPPGSRLEALYLQAVDVFGAMLERLGTPERPVLLVLDTCEELAKFRLPGARLPSLERTFRALERVHDRLAGRLGAERLPFRVIFSGRRPLAQRGHLWRLAEGQVGGKREWLPPEKPYLALHELRGFDHDEVEAFYCDIEQVRIPSRAVYKAILRFSRETGRSAEIAHQAAGPRPRRLRYNPFDLALFAEWLRAEPELDAARIRGGAADPYIENRILERLHGRELERLLPALTLLGRFDPAVLAPLLDSPGEGEAEELFRELGDQEWIDYQRDEASDTTFQQIDLNLLPRLRRYYGIAPHPPTPRTPLVDRARERLAPVLRDLIAGDNWSALGAHHLEALLRVLPAAEAAAIWQEVERRIPAEKGWGWAIRVLERLLGEDGPVPGPEHPLWPALQATQAAALLHQQPDVDLRAHWAAVAEALERQPDAPAGRWLKARAALAAVAHHPWRELPPDVGRLDAALALAWPLLRGEPNAAEGPSRPAERHQIAAAVCAALHTSLDAAERHRTFLWEDADPIEAWAAELANGDYPADLVAFARCCAGRAWLLARNSPQVAAGVAPAQYRLALGPLDSPAAEPARIASRGSATLEQAAESDLSGVADLPAGRWLDWRPPDDLQARLRLEWLRGQLAAGQPLDPLPLAAWRAEAVAQGIADSLERECLAALALQVELDHRLPDPADLDRLLHLPQLTSGRRPHALVHDRVSTLALALAHSLIAWGRATEAIELLKEAHGQIAAGSGDRRLTAEDTGAGMMAAVRRMRLRSQRSMVEEWSQTGTPLRFHYGWPAATLSGLRPPTAGPANVPIRGPELLQHLLLHTLARCRLPEEDPAGLALAIDAILKGGSHYQPTAVQRAALALDLHEITGARVVPAQADWPNQPGILPAEALRQALRLEALGRGRPVLADDLVAAVPPRRAAEIALDEGELLALRRPELAKWLLQRAANAFQQAADPIGALQAGIVEALALRRSEPGRLADFVERELRPRYEAARERLPAVLPEWGGMSAPGDQEDRIFGAWEWDHWMMRLWLVTQTGVLATDQLRGRGLDEIVRQLYGDRVPPEFSTTVADSRRRATVGDMDAHGRAERETISTAMPEDGERRMSVRWLKWAGVALGLLLALVLVFANLAEPQASATPPPVATGPGPSPTGTPPPPPSAEPDLGDLLVPALGLAAVAGLAAVLARAGLADLLTRPWRARLAARSRFTLMASAAGPDLILRLEGRLLEPAWRPPWHREQTVRAETTVAADAARPDASGRQAVGGEVKPALEALRRRLGQGAAIIALHPETAEASGPAWESWLAASLKTGRDGRALDVLNSLRVIRHVNSLATGMAFGDAGWRFGLVRSASGRSVSYLVEEAWRGAGQALLNQDRVLADADELRVFAHTPVPDPGAIARGEREATVSWLAGTLTGLRPEELATLAAELDLGSAGSTGPALEPAAVAAAGYDAGRLAQAIIAVQRLLPELMLPSRALHLVGGPVRHGPDLFWLQPRDSLAEAAGQPATKSAIQMVMQKGVRPSADPGGQLLTADQVPVALVPLIVLQVEPVAYFDGRGTFERDQAADARIFAHQLVAAGADAVLVLPAVPYPAAGVVIRRLAEGLQGPTVPAAHELLALLEAVRETIYAEMVKAAGGEDATAAEEVAGDAVLCVRAADRGTTES